ncbi:hypothetical protein D7Z26_14030 [Cohnella endophytica]|uniref:Glycoside hydrolase n=1 Tax=Cohnella endophytica TaxID=2419778 RepID=A0A494XV16_9BACL|nr:glycosyl hydrolase [Cohnella endophytica]RKP54461.1 hypothetical protein D7Z26_14030 [Cohnella endophytica]
MERTESARFQNPPSAYRPAPLWVWNDEMSEPRLREQLQALKSHGFGGAFVHPRPGLITEYLSEDWFRLWSEALTIAKELELKLYIYDENSYPSGFAGGHIPSQLPDCLANAVILKKWTKENWVQAREGGNTFLNKPGHPIRSYAYETSAEGVAIVTKEVSDEPISRWESYGEQFMVFEIGTPETNSWLGGFAYTDVLRPEVTELFIRTTYQPYYDKFSADFGNAIPAIFTDEPEISPGNLFQSGSNFLPFSYWFAAEFNKRNGYSLLDRLPALFMDVQGLTAAPYDAQKVRYDYYDTLRELWVANSVRPLSEWCEQRGIAYTGHYLEHSWPYPWGRSSPSVMSLYEYMHWPAIDMLMTKLLKNDESESHLMVTIREAHSAANQLSRERVLCEAYGAGGWDSTFEDYRRIGDWLFVHGINFMNQHLTYSTIAGARKRDHPQSFDWRQPWWEEYTLLNDYFARLSLTLSAGVTRNRVLVLNPTTSAYLMTPDQGNPGLVSDHTGDFKRDLQLFQFLCDRHWDYDFGDEFIIANRGDVREDRFIVGSRDYEVVVIPGAMTQMRSSTLELLLRLLERGGRVLALNGKLSRVDGILDEKRIARLRNKAGWSEYEDFQRLDEALRTILTPRLAWETAEPGGYNGMAHLRREHEEGTAYYFLTNSGASAQQGTLKIEGEYAECYDAWDGTVKSIPFDREGSRLLVPLTLPSSGSILLKVTNRMPADPENGSERVEDQPPSAEWSPLTLHSSHVLAESLNMLPIDYCTLNVDGKTYDEINTLHAAQKLFEHRGFATNPWDNGIQFKRRLLDRDRQYGESSGFEVRYEFLVRGDELPESAYVGIEHAGWYRVYCNDALVESQSTVSELDPNIHEIELTSFIRSGLNVITLRASIFNVRMEIEPVYIRGEFGVFAEQERWTIGRKPELAIGTWIDQGYPFYGGAVRYSYDFQLAKPAQELLLDFPEREATILSIWLNGEFIGIVGTDGANSYHFGCNLNPGMHGLEVRVCGSLKNLLGPHHDPERPRNAAWPGCWKLAPKFGRPAAGRYDLISYGLFGHIRLNYR